MRISAVKAVVPASKDTGITQQQVAAKLGQRQTFVPKVERGERRLDNAEFIRMGPTRSKFFEM